MQPDTPQTQTMPSDQNTLVQIITRRKELTVQKGDVPFDSDATMHHFYFILEGRIKISHIHPETGKEQTVTILSRGDMFDVITLLDKKSHHYTATALETSRILEVPIGHVRELIENDPNFNRYFFPYLARQMRDLESLAVDLALYDVYGRIIRLIGRNLQEDHEGYHLDLINDLSHEELATLVGTVRKVLNRNLQRLKKEGIIDISRKELDIKDLTKLFEKIDYLE